METLLKLILYCKLMVRIIFTIGSNNMPKEQFVLKLYKSKDTIFTIQEIALLFRETKRENLKARINYYVKNGVLRNLRKGIYSKPDYDPLELATKIYTPSYISLETVLAKEGIIFQYYKDIFVVSYLTRTIEVDKLKIQYKKIKNVTLLNSKEIIQKENYAIATKERAFLDTLYLYNDYYFDNVGTLDKRKVLLLLPIYQSKRLSEKVKEILTNA